MDSNSSQLRKWNTREKAKNMMWTNEMDRCLTKALVQQVKKGNKIDKSLTSTAYTAAVELLNKKFSLDLNKEHIRNRLKTWKKQYGVLKELLAQNGFQWDERQKMVVANDSVWNEYIKSNPDAKALRSRFLENYNDWCMILGDYQPTVSSYRTKVEVDVDLTIDDNEYIENADMFQICNGSSKEKGKNMMWTTEMDCCLTRTLVDLVKQSNRNDNVLNIAAYTTAATTTLNENFRFDLMTDHVRNRLKTWRKQYGVIKELLSQSGFEWDGKQKMVIAEDSVWNDYIKTHPDAKAFQARYIENYDELCLIFGNDKLEESCSRNGTELAIYLPAENEGGETFDTCQTRGDDPKEKGKYIVWTNEMDRCLTEILVNQVNKGNKKEKFLNKAYLAAVKVINERFSLNLSKDHVRNRLKTWKKQYGMLKELLSLSGFQWDDERKMVVAHDYIWNEYLKEHPDARVIRGKLFENYEELCIIFGNDQTTGSLSRNGADNEEHVEAADQCMSVDNDIKHGDIGEGLEESSQQTGAQPASSSRSKRPLRKKRANDMLLETMSTMAANIGRIADALGQNCRTVNFDELFDMVQKIPGFDDDLIIEACEYLSVDEKKAMMFLKLNERLRRIWLLKRLRSHSD
ncbi:L10-interacting MYB domain-containing protein-like isoform X1 [Macadamia integrifolia]|uniref:L10-interacting MYB domain-containing protein-like isoform X1 n=1 Tax=Macadamia integrifolia TaxID=60698 RepID=UPI001C4EDFEC|nr:L10-interacting MYB domain-containing protein-like isoform X1 [Macadamia integrifolia]XP_042484103.1 L10-interacting MYB domain-containing protein-like isoform X1 [Macadamia integrifolia]XP_042484104.1 L10-interacting MYB domain-containing protein-like isoform X1 [Macadamia integrifolia]XP_042484105.1 L10-interacting MYB domain-containing protein-like isoform X1 [Macadamia integrifolia]